VAHLSLTFSSGTTPTKLKVMEIFQKCTRGVKSQKYILENSQTTFSQTAFTLNVKPLDIPDKMLKEKH
jgi:hypothetical protein